MPIVNGHPAECGCYVEGRWGQYGPDHLAEQAETFGWEPPTVETDYLDHPVLDDPRVWRKLADRAFEAGEMMHSDAFWTYHFESVDDIETWLNDRTEDDCRHCGKAASAHVETLCPWPCYPNAASIQHYVWHWHDGEFFLSPMCEDPEECSDETCAHHD